MLQGQTRAGPYLGFITGLEGDLQPGGDQGPGPRFQGHRRVFRHRCAQVHPGGAAGLIGRQGQAFGMGQAFDADGGHAGAAFRL